MEMLLTKYETYAQRSLEMYDKNSQCKEAA